MSTNSVVLETIAVDGFNVGRLRLLRTKTVIGAERSSHAIVRKEMK